MLATVLAMTAAGTALCVSGNHESKLLRALRGRDVKVTHGLAESLAQLKAAPEEFRTQVIAFLDGLISHYVLDGGRLVVAHAGLRQEMHGRASAAVRSFALYGETTGETDEFGLPVRYPWAQDYRGQATVVYGHTPVPVPVWVNNTICIDTGCVFGGRLTALRYPERELVSVPARSVYYQPARPLVADGGATAAAGTAAGGCHGCGHTGERARRPARHRRRARQAGDRDPAARAGLDPGRERGGRAGGDEPVRGRPAMADLPAAHDGAGAGQRPAGAARASGRRAGRLPARRRGAGGVRGEAHGLAGRGRGLPDARPRPGTGSAPSRPASSIPARAGGSLPIRPWRRNCSAGCALRSRSAGLWDDLGDWAALDCEILPWSLKADELISSHYAAVGAAAVAGLGAATEMLDAARARGLEVTGLRERTGQRRQAAESFVRAYRPYVWPVASLDDVRLAPFQVLAGSAGTCFGRDHEWHMTAAGRLAGADPLIKATRYLAADLADPGADAAVTAWWEELTGGGGEGMVVKPAAPVTRGRHGLAQPGIKCRGPEYLRIIYGPEYSLAGNLARLRERSLGRKRSLAGSEFALGVEALERFTRREPAFRVHECVFGVLALESEPVDPRL